MLPEYIEDSPPPRARRIERARRAVLDWFFANDYAPVITPLVEHIDALIAGADADLDARTLKLTDTMSGRTLGVRADITPQAARIAGRLPGDAIIRLCYCGPALCARPPQPWRSREILQIGAEIYNCPDIGGDLEIAALAIGALARVKAPDIAADIGSAAVFNHICESADARDALRAAVSRRDQTTICEIAPPPMREPLCALCEISGGEDAITTARKRLPDSPPIKAALDDAAALYAGLQSEAARVRFDFSELGGYAYHSGAVFAVYAGGAEIGRGGRYQTDGGKPASGFSMDLKQLADFILIKKEEPPAVAAVAAPADAKWRAAVEKLQSQGRRVRLLHTEEERTADITPRLSQNKSGEWRVEEEEK
jgi:ATP phosphoribosyltransferase regulatory subunit